MTMSGKDRAGLRSEAHHLTIAVHIGQGGISPSLLASFDDVLRTRELVKAQVSKNGELSARDAAESASSALSAEIIQVIGRTFTLYRQNPDLVRGDQPAWKS